MAKQPSDRMWAVMAHQALLGAEATHVRLVTGPVRAADMRDESGHPPVYVTPAAIRVHLNMQTLEERMSVFRESMASFTGLTESFEQAIRDTDDAFQAIGSSLAGLLAGDASPTGSGDPLAEVRGLAQRTYEQTLADIDAAIEG